MAGRFFLFSIILAVVFLFASDVVSAQIPTDDEFVNSIGMKFVRIEAGRFEMGNLSDALPFDMMPEDGGPGIRMDALRTGDFDEKPVHKVRISKPFYAGVYEVTNLQYEMFDAEHKKLRGKDSSLSQGDGEAVVNVSWYDAVAFCRWLSDKEGLNYRLPTEAEWEYACRAGTTTNFNTGDDYLQMYRKNQWLVRGPEKVDLTVGLYPANSWGLYDMHGNVEEWCADWYGPYKADYQKDPTGYENGDFRVARGGSHSTYVYYLRSSNRMGAMPEDQHWLLGFRVVIGAEPAGKKLQCPQHPMNQQNVKQRDPLSVLSGPDPKKPYFARPKSFVRIPADSAGPVFALHNHDPAIVECPNGDLLACWYSCLAEKNRELCQVASRLRWGSDQWEQASPFWDVPDRNDHAPAMWYDGNDTIYHFTGMSFGGGYNNMVIVMRKSTDSGATWSCGRIITPGHSGGHMPVEAVFRTNDHGIALTSDGSPTLWLSDKDGIHWRSCGGAIRGNHPGVLQLNGGSFYGLTRDMQIEGRMPIVTSVDAGKTWDYKPSDFPSIHGGQRLVLMKLREGPLFFASFADKGIEIVDKAGVKRKVRGVFTALSTDQGTSWPYKRLVSDDGPGTAVQSTNGGLFTMSARIGEYYGYMAGCQGANRIIHLITSKTHYAFNLKWLMTPSDPINYPPLAVKTVRETFDGSQFDNQGWIDYKSYRGNFTGEGTYRIQADGRNSGINRIVGEGSFEAKFVLRNLKCNPEGARGLKGAAIWFRDGLAAKQGVYLRRGDIGLSEGADVRYEKTPEVFTIRTVWNASSKRWQVFYGFDGDQPVNELQRSKAGIYLDQPFTEATSCYIMAANGAVDVDEFEIRPLD